jgi:hypothetical protein
LTLLVVPVIFAGVEKLSFARFFRRARRQKPAGFRRTRRGRGAGRERVSE